MKIQKSLLAVLILTLFPLFVFGQLKHELKIVPLDLFSAFSPSYELVINKKIGLELEMSFDTREAFISNFTGGAVTTEEVDRKRFIPGISGKYYFLFNKYGSGFYIGPHFKSTFNTYIEQGFEDRYFQINNTSPPHWVKKGFQSFATGLNGGFKWLIKERFIVEYSNLLTVFYTKEENGKFEAQGTDLDVEIRIGYRF